MCVCACGVYCHFGVRHLSHSNFAWRWISLFDSDPIHHRVYVPAARCLIRRSPYAAAAAAAAADVVAHYAAAASRSMSDVQVPVAA